MVNQYCAFVKLQEKKRRKKSHWWVTEMVGKLENMVTTLP